MPRKPTPLLERFERFLPDQLRDDECWEWQGRLDRDGYGKIKDQPPGRYSLSAHRVAWEAHHAEPVPHGLQVCHHCDNPACVNPAHLFIGTNADNNADKVSKGRHSRGETSGRRRLSDAQVLEIRSLYSSGACAQEELARQFGVRKSSISQIIRRETWRHLPGETSARQRIRGETHSQARLTEAQVLEIRQLYKVGDTTQRYLAIRFSTTHKNISAIILRKTWRHLP